MSARNQQPQKIKLKSADNVIFEINIEVAKMSGTIKNIIEDVGVTFNSDDDCIPIPNTNSDILEKVFEYCEYHYNNDVPDDDKNML